VLRGKCKTECDQTSQDQDRFELRWQSM